MHPSPATAAEFKSYKAERELLRKVVQQVKIFKDGKEFWEEVMRVHWLPLPIGIIMLIIGIARDDTFVRDWVSVGYVVLSEVALAVWVTNKRPPYRSVQELADQVRGIFSQEAGEGTTGFPLKADDVKSVFEELKDGETPQLRMQLLTTLGSFFPWSVGVLFGVAFLGKAGLQMLRVSDSVIQGQASGALPVVCFFLAMGLGMPQVIQTIEKHQHQRRLRGLREFERQLREEEAWEAVQAAAP